MPEFLIINFKMTLFGGLFKNSKNGETHDFISWETK